MATSTSCSRANRTAAMTSAADVHRTTAPGCRSKQRFQISRDTSNRGSAAVTNSPESWARSASSLWGANLIPGTPSSRFQRLPPKQPLLIARIRLRNNVSCCLSARPGLRPRASEKPRRRRNPTAVGRSGAQSETTPTPGDPPKFCQAPKDRPTTTNYLKSITSTQK